MAKKHEEIAKEPEIVENISNEPLDEVMGDRYATYAKYVIQDRAIPDARDGLKPVQRRIIFSMFKSNNVFNRPTKKCAHTVGAVMGTFHPHGDTSIYEALARMSQDWKVRYPLIHFQGNNGSIDGDSPAAYRYTESKLSEISNELIRDIDKKTVDMQLNFDDSEFEPTVLPSRFPNLFANGTEGIAVGMATEIPPHNLKELIDAIIYRINHKDNVTVSNLREFVKGPDFPGGGVIYNSSGLDSIYESGKGRIEIGCKAEIVEQKLINQIVITEIPYKVQKNLLVYEVDKIIHSKQVSGMVEVRDESDFNGIRIAVDVKKDAKADLLLQYLMNKTSMKCSYSANIVAIVDGRPKTLNLLDYIDSYIKHQIDVVTRKSQFDLKKDEDRLHIVNGLIFCALNIKKVVEVITASKDKADSKVNLMKEFNLSSEQSEAILMMPLHKISHADVNVIEEEKKSLEDEINTLKGILEDPNKLDKVIIKDLKAISNRFGDNRRTIIVDSIEEKAIDKRELIAKENVMVSVSYDGYVKRSTIKSYKGSNESLPGLKGGDILLGFGSAYTTEFLLLFTNKGNFFSIPVHLLNECKWKDEGVHVNEYTTLSPQEKIIKCFIVDKLRSDLYLAILTGFGQIKRICLNSLDLAKHSKPVKYMKLMSKDVVTGISLLTGNSDIFVCSSNGNATLFNENQLTILSTKASGVKSIQGLGNNTASCLLSFAPEEKSRIVLITNKGHRRITDISRYSPTLRLGKTFDVCPSFKNDMHKVVKAFKYDKSDAKDTLTGYLSNLETISIDLDDLKLTDSQYAKKNINLPAKAMIITVSDNKLQRIDKSNISFPVKADKNAEQVIEQLNISPSNEGQFENISLFENEDKKDEE